MALQLMLLKPTDILLNLRCIFTRRIYLNQPSYCRLLQMAHIKKVSESVEGSGIEKEHSPPPVQEMPEGGVQAWAVVIGA
jgi:hypothetical protein